ncbi:PAS domain S-box protein [Candidatus Protochlamydia phocaeensis]|uniref:PAS domain S-box protein n=1 Tax=Candidatus Protochlamydia phocaeensis TaxID=1414722 RepID=UPI0008390028|nr:PAS domain S-box protein [Candidatus Protochlamydia phocaeensis]
MKFDKYSRVTRAIALVTGFISLAISLIHLISWHIHYYPVLEIGADLPPIQYNTALLLALSSLALIYDILISNHFSLSRWLGFIIGGWGLLTLIEYVGKIDLGIDELFFKSYIVSPSYYPGRMSPLTALAFIFIGSAFSFLSHQRINPTRSTLAFIFTILVFAVGFFGLFNYFISIQTTLGISHATAMALLTGITLILLSIGILSRILYFNHIHHIDISYLYPFLVSIGVFLFCLLEIWGVWHGQAQSLHRDIKEKAREIRANLSFELEEKGFLLVRMVRRTELRPISINSTEWEQDALFLMENVHDLKQIAWLDSDFHVQNFIPKQAQLVDFSNLFSDELKQEVETIPSSRFLIKYFSPYLIFIIPPDETQNMYLVGLANSYQLFDTIIQNLASTDYTIQVLQDSILIYQLNESPTPTMKQWSDQSHLELPGLDLILDVFPSTAKINETINQEIRWISILGGFLLSCILGILIYLWQFSQRKLKQIQQISEELTENQDKLDLALKSAEMGVWSWNLETDQVFTDSHTSSFLGLPNRASLRSWDEAFIYVLEEDKNRLKLQLNEALNNRGSLETHIRIASPQQPFRYLSIKGKIGVVEKESTLKMTGICWDITENQRNLKLLEGQLAVAKILQTSISIKEAAPKILEALGKDLEWDIAVFWELKDNAQEMECLNIWHVPSFNIEEFEKETRDLILHKGQSFLGEIWDYVGPLWIQDIELKHNFAQAEKARAIGLKGALGFPILAMQKDKNIVLGVIEFFRRTRFNDKIDIFFLNFCYAIGSTIGLFMQQKKDESAQAFLASIVQCSNEAIISKNLDGIITSWNKGAEQIFYYTEEEAIGKSVQILYPPEKFEELQYILDITSRGEFISTLETVRKRKNGELCWCLAAFSPIKDRTGAIVGSCAIARDISEFKRAQEEAQKHQENFRAFIETTNDWIWSIDAEGKITFSNNAIKTILGYKVEEIIGADISFLLDAGDRKKWTQEFKNYLNKQKGWIALVHQWRHKNGSIKWLESNAEPIISAQGEITGYRGADRDITERVHADKVKNEFISVVSHELRTPLTSIRGSLGLLIGKSKEELKPRSLHLIEIAYNNCERLIRLINDILDMEKMEVGKIELHFEPLNIDDLIHTAVESSQSYAEKFKVQIKVEQLTEGAKIFGSADRLLQVLDNLLSNAIKFSNPNGHVFISATQNTTSVRVSIKDEGCGIEDSFQNQVFKKFAQADASSSRPSAGTGLGLYICKNIIEKHGGTIHFISKVKEGTTFYFDLPKWHEAVPLIQCLPQDSSIAPFLLILSSNTEFSKNLKRELEENGLLADIVSTLSQATVLVQKQAYSAAIIDVEGIKGEDIELIKEIYNKGLNPQLPIILVSSDQEKNKEMGKIFPIFGWLDKQADSGQISTFIQGIKKRLNSQLPKVLYVEDDLELIEVIKIIVKDQLQIFPVCTLKEAREKLASEEFDLVLLDLILPDGTGADLLPCLNPRTGQIIPVVIFSAREEDRQYGSEVKRFLVKSRTTESELIRILKSIIASKETQIIEEDYGQ